MKHTQGPWRIMKDPDVPAAFNNGVWSGNICIAEEIRDQDAHLIAAAPEMLEELELIARFFSDHGAMKGEDSDPEKQILISVNALIKKAKGEL